MENLLQRYKEHCEHEKERPNPITNTTYLFRRQDSELSMSPNTFTSKFKMILRKHTLPENLNVHSPRHTNANFLIANGTDVPAVAGQLGHSQVSTTLDIYTHSFDAKRKEESRALMEKLKS